LVLYKVHNNMVISWHDGDVRPAPHNAKSPEMKYTVKPAIVEGCECEECKAGRHLYFLYRCSELESGRWSGVTLHTYASAQECKEDHYWGIRFGPDDVWEDGSPIVQPDPLEGMRAGDRKAGTGGHGSPQCRSAQEIGGDAGEALGFTRFKRIAAAHRNSIQSWEP
jgi:hypothetical protein